ncbi:hypothetical protein CLAFUW4_12506 [Fulvia fulva]|uniref:HTH La-type RNA-binding domain-containing protein n=1 Tax=Passalora fulva TaxID=5499 RepID=A0A9Q8USA6_PASFU|nr:uncharacterized protein CLAFUR5_11532 [Fulvia fulva]KAK4617957.1 hypothetical protein CLAFUR4_12511 [Fulvia fulva]KAK4618876.1 hypothetical protein CLAFUR0_12522 [Fulvia fulva]UJO20576.1 hypothetical protein CLAFUR5_11532 [Fulvia fulva]WPV18126.1 hypothetical protein CLAFUW4_12506 [Fulvia fulva]WPV33374.1 hypothetical protein CLAFUW7_12513 [Fulvia fulva]
MTNDTADTMPSPASLTDTTDLAPPTPAPEAASETVSENTNPAENDSNPAQTNGTSNNGTPTNQTVPEPANNVPNWTIESEPLAIQPHEQRDEIIRQVEFYFSDENLPHDAHLLSKAGEYGDGWVSLSTIMGFRKMKQYKPAARVKAALSLPNDTFVVWKNKLIRRKQPLQKSVVVVPKVNPSLERNAQMVEKPWMTKAMFKPTGFEKDFVEGPITPADHETERRLFDPEEAFTERIQHAVTRYTSKRKMHQNTAKIFGSFIMFGGFAGGQAMFTGGLSKTDLEDYDKDQIEAMKARYAVSEAVLDGIYEDQEGGATWVVDFEAVAKSYLSIEFMAAYNWKDQKAVDETTNIMVNFYNYLIYHDVCPEYEERVMKARDICVLAGEELIKLAEVDNLLPGQFNIACSTLYDGYYKEMRPVDPNAEWLHPDDFKGISVADATKILSAAIMAWGTSEQVAAYATATQQGKLLEITSEDEIGLEIVSVEMSSGEGKELYDRLKNTTARPLGKLHCVQWEMPGAGPKDLPAHVTKQQKAKIGSQHQLLVDEATLCFCYPGLKIEALVKTLSNGIEFVDHYKHAYPSFYTWTLNDRIRDWKEPGPPKAWMQRQNAKKGVKGKEMVRREDEEEQNTPD